MKKYQNPETAALFHALSDEKRLGIIDLLSHGERCVCDIGAPLDIKQSLLSFHLKVLKEAGIVRSVRVGKWVHYSITPGIGDRLVEVGSGLSKAAKKAKVVFCC